MRIIILGTGAADPDPDRGGSAILIAWIRDRQIRPVVEHLFEDGAFAKDIEARTRFPRWRKNLAVLMPDNRECEPGIEG